MLVTCSLKYHRRSNGLQRESTSLTDSETQLLMTDAYECSTTCHSTLEEELALTYMFKKFSKSSFSLTTIKQNATIRVYELCIARLYHYSVLLDTPF